MSSGIVPPHRSYRRDQLLERLIASLTTPGPDALNLRDRALTEPTIALLDAWATVGDVLGFYSDRIADEGYLSSAVEPGSVLALTGAFGPRPHLGVAAQVYLAYTLNVDPDDTAIRLPPGLLAQSLPGPGEQPQTFETTDALTARPSWSVLSPKQTQPLRLGSADQAPNLDSLVVRGATANLAVNDTILLDIAGAPAPALLRVASATVNATANVTHVKLQTSTEAEQPPSTSPSDVTVAINDVMGALSTQPASVPASVNELPRTLTDAFSAGSDATPRLLSALRPEVGAQLYQALDKTALGESSVSAASVLRVKAAPFGAQAPPRQLFDERGQPAGTEDWPIGDTHRLTLSLTDRHFGTLLDRTLTTVKAEDQPVGARLSALAARLMTPREGVAAADDPILEVGVDLADFSRKAVIQLKDSSPPDIHLDPAHTATFSVDGPTVTLSYTGPDTRINKLQARATMDQVNDAVALQFDSDEEPYLWDPNVRAPIRAHVGNRRLSIAWSTTPPGDEVLTLSIETPLPLAEPTVLPLDGVYSEIRPGDTIVIDRADPATAPKNNSDVAYPVITRIESVETVAASAYGVTSHVTRVTLHPEHPWVGTQDVLQTSLREITVRSRPTPLDLAPVPVPDDVAGESIELDRLVAGMQAGRLIIVRGIRADLPGVKSGELAMVKSISAGATDGDTTHTTLHLASQLAYHYQRDTVEIFGNVVPARQGATIQEVLGSGQPAVRRQAFTLSAGPLLADAAPGPGGSRSTLTVEVGGLGYAEVQRFRPDTAPRSFLTGTDSRGHTTILFAAALPAGVENVKATYRAGDGGAGNVRADQVTQLLSRPAGLSSVTNPLPGFGGLAGDGPDAVRAATPRQLSGLGRVVTVSDYADLASTWAAVGKATAQEIHDGRQHAVLVTVAGKTAAPLDPRGSLCTGIAAAIAEAADPAIPVLVAPAGLWVIVLEARVTRDPLISWDDTVSGVTAALLAAFGYEHRELGEDVAVGDLIGAAHQTPAVRSFVVSALALVPATATAEELSSTLPGMLASPVPDVLSMRAAAAAWGIASSPPDLAPADVSYLTNAAPDTLILIESTP